MTKNIIRPVRLEFSNISKSYGKGKKAKIILNNVSLKLKGGACTLITGSNGCGKSTLLRIMGGLLKPDSAQINTGLHTLNWKKYRKTMGNSVMYLYQEPYMFDGTVSQNLKYAVSKKQNIKLVDDALKWAELEHRRDTQAKCLSGGEKQRVALAQAWIKQPAVLLLDEPTSNMDADHRRRTESLLSTFIDSGTALYIASHDPNHFHNIMNQRLILENKRLVKYQQADDALLQSSQNIRLFSKEKAQN